MKAESIGTTISDLQAQLDRHRELTEKKSGIVKSGDKQKKRKGVSKHASKVEQTEGRTRDFEVVI